MSVSSDVDRSKSHFVVTQRVCVVTGASSGIGRRVALDLAAAGARVCVAARREDRLQTLVAEIGGEPAGHSYVVTDVSQRDHVKNLARHVGDTYGRLDVLINNAGFSGNERVDGPESVDEVERVFATNFFGAVYCTAELLPLLEASAPSHVVNVASMAGRIAVPGNATYAASKFALVGWTEALQPDLARRGVYLSSVEPGFVPTEGFPQKNMVEDRFMKYLLGTDAQVSEAILDAIENRKPQRVVPRFYYLFQLPRVLTPGLYRRVLAKVMDSSVGRKAADFR
ncbi:MAG: SDR family oxidoreductase [Actinomycetota bacterium]|nr:SDR family oxidoreductase [Actinomycetota bacterium]